MKKTIRITILVMILCLWSMKVYGITLDGRFQDWSDKPYVTDPARDGAINEDLIQVGWYPDVATNKLFMYLKRGGSIKPGKWDSYVDILFGSEIYHININSNSNSKKVSVWLYDKSSNLLWYGSGNWCDTTSVEFYVPLTGIIDAQGAGYSMEVTAFTNSDRAPNEGSIVISTISTYPILTFIVSGLMIILTYIKRRKGGQDDIFGIYLGGCSRALKLFKSKIF